ncbi:TPA: type II toxin-antitoxin system YafQ family toxin [Candidatus Falkowbacteria bacterium]|nr:MAG: Addiction module toxin, RelE/StbE family [Candidatus Falkowbacteria bacterium GW2011_GWF2_43_32]HBA36516.1 type II toxin-antitoxin system YafQ family toxin [Candidatus Falkowbacteria bacterium]
MFLLKFSSRFKKDLKLYKHDKIFLVELEKVLDILAKGKDLPDKNLNHPLIGEFKGCFECHVKPDILLIYKIEKSELIVLLLRAGSHSHLF